MDLQNILAICFLVFIKSSQSELVYEWNKIDVDPLPIQNWRPTSFTVTKDQVFLTVVDVNRNSPGNGLLAWFNKTSNKSPILKIYPSPTIYKRVNAKVGKIVTPLSVRTDHCNRLWLLDTAVRSINGTQIKENPGIFIFNLSTGKLIRNYPIPLLHWSDDSFFVNFVSDSEKSENGCDDTFAYFADFNSNSLLIYDFKKNDSDVKRHHFFSPDPLIFVPEDYIYNIDQRDVNGIYGLALVKNFHNESNKLYFHPLASRNEFSIPTDKLKSKHGLEYKDIQVYKNKGDNTEAGISVYDEHSESIFFAEIHTGKIGCWNLDFAKANIPVRKVYNRLDAHIPEGYVIDLNVLDSELWILVRHKSKISIYRENIADLVKGTSCEVAKSESYFNSPLNLLVLFAIFNSLITSV